jgi:hypothetical protein
MDQEESKIKKVIDKIVSKLLKEGVQVQSAGFIKLDETSNTEDKEKIINEVMQNVIKDIKEREEREEKQKPKPRSFENIEEFKNFLDSLKKKITDAQDSYENRPLNEDGQCLCNQCQEFHGFEKKHKNDGGVFEYQEITLLGKVFCIKYWRGENDDDDMIVREKSEIDTPKKEQPLKDLSSKEIQILLDEAIDNRDFVKAEYYVNLLQNNQN